MVSRTATILILIACACNVSPVEAQDTTSRSAEDIFGRYPHLWPLAAQISPRIGAATELTEEHVLLEIGTSLSLYETSIGRSDASDVEQLDQGDEPVLLSLGADFFTWSRLRTESRFKFPVEAVDYYFGVHGLATTSGGNGMRLGTALRLAHISAHLVDGAESFQQTSEGPFTYSREFLDASLSISEHGSDSVSTGSLQVLGYGGIVWTFSSIPSLDRAVTPYVGGDARLVVGTEPPVMVRIGAEARADGERTGTVDLTIRGGVVFAQVYGMGLGLEATFYRGVTRFGQFWPRIEESFSVGFTLGP